MHQLRLNRTVSKAKNAGGRNLVSQRAAMGDTQK